MNELEKAKHAKVQRIDVSDVNCRKCFYLDQKNFCTRNRFPVLNHEAACKHFLYDKDKHKKNVDEETKYRQTWGSLA